MKKRKAHLLIAWITMDVPDTDFMVTLHEIRPYGTSIQLTDDALRARYRESPERKHRSHPARCPAMNSRKEKTEVLYEAGRTSLRYD